MQPMSQSARRLVSRRPISILFQSQASLQSTLLRRSFFPRRDLSSRSSYALTRRYNSSLSVPGVEPRAQDPNARADEPSYQLSFTCKPCLYRSSHRVTKHGYHHGTVLVTCPSCKSRHIIADHLKIFLDNSQTLEDILRQKAEDGQDFIKLLKKGRLGIRPGEMVGNEGEEDLEFWEDGTETQHTPIEESQTK